MDVEAHLEALDQLLAEARPVPLSGLVMVHRHDAEDLVAEARIALPEDLRQARWILKERDELLDTAARQADGLRADARAEVERMVSETEVVRAARREAERVLSEAEERARVLRMEAEDYVDATLADLAGALHRAVAEVDRGRDRLRAVPRSPTPNPLFDQERAAD